MDKKVREFLLETWAKEKGYQLASDHSHWDYFDKQRNGHEITITHEFMAELPYLDDNKYLLKLWDIIKPSEPPDTLDGLYTTQTIQIRFVHATLDQKATAYYEEYHE